MIIFSDLWDPIFNYRDPNRVPKTPLKNPECNKQDLLQKTAGPIAIATFATIVNPALVGRGAEGPFHPGFRILQLTL